jgi:hypothetical protein
VTPFHLLFARFAHQACKEALQRDDHDECVQFFPFLSPQTLVDNDNSKNFFLSFFSNNFTRSPLKVEHFDHNILINFDYWYSWGYVGWWDVQILNDRLKILQFRYVVTLVKKLMLNRCLAAIWNMGKTFLLTH